MYLKTFFIALISINILFPSIANASAKQKKQQVSDSQQAKETTTANYSTSFRPPKKSQPQYTVGGATRGDTCAIGKANKDKITALVPEKNQSLTLQSHPSFFAYLSPLNEEKSATLIVKDTTEDYYYSQQLNIPASGGIVKMTLEPDAPPLEIGKDYTWFLRIQCDANPKPEDPLISGSITRVQKIVPELSQNDLMLFYADSQIWYDSLDTAFDFSQSGEDIYWSQLLSDISMDKLITK